MERRRPEPTLPNVAAPHPPRHLLTWPDTGLVSTRSHTASSPVRKHNALNQKSINPVLRIRSRMFFGPPGSGSFFWHLLATRSHTASSPACKHNALYQKSINPVLRIRIRIFFGIFWPGQIRNLSRQDPTHPPRLHASTTL
jgi:hypothetical protein